MEFGADICAYLQIQKTEPNSLRTKFIKNDDIELWWDMKIPTKPALPHNKPDLILWWLNEERTFVRWPIGDIQMLPIIHHYATVFRRFLVYFC